MNKIDIKRVINKLTPDKEMEYRLSKKILQKQHNRLVFKPLVSIAASIIMVICIGILGYNFIGKGSNISTNSINSTDGIYIPKVALAKNKNAEMKVKSLIVYQSRVYTQTSTKITVGNAENLIDEKLGRTKGNIDEWSKQNNYAVEFASSIAPQDVYSVNGYDKSFRIMTYEKINGTINAKFYECLNGFTVKTGADIFNKIKIANNIKSVKYENLESWNNDMQQYKELTKLQVLNNFVTELKNTIPYQSESLSLLNDDNRKINEKFIFITLNDGSEVQLRLFKNGYIYYDYCHIFFKMENTAFQKLWNELE